ncbi:MAG TPA: site-2 protease family protein [Methylomirabilota bacterium]|nr:site-2 protease family protein [Methylomirabilota bacterium]
MRFWPFLRRTSPVPPLPSEDLLVTEERLRRAAEDVLEVHERQIRGGVIVFRGRLRTEAPRALDTLLGRFEPFGYTPFLRAERDGVLVQAWPLGDLTQPARPVLALTLFALTVVSTFLAGAFFFVGSETFDAYRALPFPGWIVSGTPFAVTLLAILGVHEFGHYFTARYYGAAVSLPYFIPAPMLFGTFGAVIRMRSPARDRNSLFDIAAAGPLAGLLVAIPALVLGLGWSRLVPASGDSGLGGFGYSLLTRAFVHLRFGEVDGMAVVTHPMADAAWVGCFVTALNLFPVGQLDGGRIAYALSGRRHRALGVATWVVLLALGALTGSVNWFVWAALLLLLVGFDHGPPLDDLTPLTRARRLIGIACLVLTVFLVPPIPV